MGRVTGRDCRRVGYGAAEGITQLLAVTGPGRTATPHPDGQRGCHGLDDPTDGAVILALADPGEV